MQHHRCDLDCWIRIPCWWSVFAVVCVFHVWKSSRGLWWSPRRTSRSVRDCRPTYIGPIILPRKHRSLGRNIISRFWNVVTVQGRKSSREKYLSVKSSDSHKLVDLSDSRVRLGHERYELGRGQGMSGSRGNMGRRGAGIDKGTCRAWL